MREFAALDGPPDDEILSHYTRTRVLPDGRVVGTKRLLMHWTMHVDVTAMGYSERYCYETEALANASMEAWDGTGHPDHWHKHPTSGTRRDPATGETWHESEDAKRLFRLDAETNEEAITKGPGR